MLAKGLSALPLILCLDCISSTAAEEYGSYLATTIVTETVFSACGSVEPPSVRELSETTCLIPT